MNADCGFDHRFLCFFPYWPPGRLEGPDYICAINNQNNRINKQKLPSRIENLAVTDAKFPFVSMASNVLLLLAYAACQLSALPSLSSNKARSDDFLGNSRKTKDKEEYRKKANFYDI